MRIWQQILSLHKALRCAHDTILLRAMLLPIWATPKPDQSRGRYFMVNKINSSRPIGTCVSKIGSHWYRIWPVASSAPRHYLSKCAHQNTFGVTQIGAQYFIITWMNFKWLQIPLCLGVNVLISFTFSLFHADKTKVKPKYCKHLIRELNNVFFVDEKDPHMLLKSTLVMLMTRRRRSPGVSISSHSIDTIDVLTLLWPFWRGIFFSQLLVSVRNI